jgi:ATP-binding cassette subfamily B protein
MSKTTKLTFREQARAVGGVARLSFQTAPGAVIFKLVGSLINALLPIATTYYAALTTTTLVEAVKGGGEAKRHVIAYVIITALLGLVMTVWRPHCFHSLSADRRGERRHCLAAGK